MLRGCPPRWAVCRVVMPCAVRASAFTCNVALGFASRIARIAATSFGRASASVFRPSTRLPLALLARSRAPFSLATVRALSFWATAPRVLTPHPRRCGKRVGGGEGGGTVIGCTRDPGGEGIS